MKIALFAVLSVLVFSGCTKNYPQVNQVYSALYTVQPNQWLQATDNGSGKTFFQVSLNIPELTQQIDLNGGVAVYLSFDDPASANINYEALPEVIDGIAYGAIHSTGSVTIDLRDAYGESINQAITAPVIIKVVLMDAQPLGN